MNSAEFMSFSVLLSKVGMPGNALSQVISHQAGAFFKTLVWKYPIQRYYKLLPLG